MTAPAALQPPGGALPPQLNRSFVDVLTTTSLPRISQSHPSRSPTLNPSNHTHTLATHGTHRGFPSIAFSDSENADLSKPFTWALIDKFSQGYNKQDPKLGRPSVDELQKYFAALDFKGSFQLGLLDNRHLLIQFQREEDYIRMFSRMVWYIGRVTMRILKWSPFFHVDKESSVVPIWISLPHLPVHLFQKAPLFSIASLFGHPLRLDAATTTLKRPSVARVQVEIDILKELPGKIWVQLGTQEGFWQQVDFENVPSYCSHCWKIGHAQEFCHVQNPTLRNKPATQPRQVFLAKENSQQSDTVGHSRHVVQEQTLVAKQSQQQQSDSSDVIILQGEGSLKPPPFEQIPGPTADDSGKLSHVVTPGAAEFSTLLLQTSSPTGPEKVAGLHPSVASSLEVPEATSARHVLTPAHPNATDFRTSAHPSATDSGHPLVAQEISFSPLPVVIPSDVSSMLVSVTPYPKARTISSKNAPRGVSIVQEISKDLSEHNASVNDEVEEVFHAQHPLVLSSQQQPIHPPLDQRPNITIPVQEISPEQSLAVVTVPIATISSVLQDHPTPIAQQETEATPGLALPPYAMGYHDNAYYGESFESDKIVNDDADEGWSSAYDITDGSEGTIRQKRRDRRKSKAQPITNLATKDELMEQSRQIGKALKKRGRPPGSRNRTFFDVVRTMDTRNTKSTST